MTGISTVVPCHNPDESIFQTIASVRAQTWPHVELVLVDDGTDRTESAAIVDRAARLADRFLRQDRRGLAAARNEGILSAAGEWVIPLDAGDLILPAYAKECARVLATRDDAAFVYTGLETFGAETRVNDGIEYNLFLMLKENHVTCTALLRKADWELAGGYDESMRSGYEDWEFWLRLGARGRYGALVPKPLFRRRTRGPLPPEPAKHNEIVQGIRAKHPELYSYEARSRIKAAWQPAVCICGPHPEQTIRDLQVVSDAAEAGASTAEVVLCPGPRGAASDASELAALAVWGGHATLRLPDGSLALSREAARSKWTSGVGRPVRRPGPRADSRGRLFRRVRQHLANAELDSWDAWLRHPARSAARLAPLRVKEQINGWVGRPVFDLSFYLQFQPSSILVGHTLAPPLRYMPAPPTRRRVALVTPHLGPGGAERVLLDMASALDRQRFELLVLATHSSDDRWARRWHEAAEHVYDLAPLISLHRRSAAVCSIVANWQCEVVLVQNSLFGYAALPSIRKDAPGVRILDVVHATGGEWDQVAATAAVSGVIDVRVAVSESVRQRLSRAGAPEERIRLIKNGVDLARFRPQPMRRRRRVLFGARLDRVKRPLLLVDIADRLARLRGRRDFRMVIAGDGPELPAVRALVGKRGMEGVFEFLGHVDDMPARLAEADVVLLTSREEGVPLVVLEAMASGRPVVVSKVGAIAEAVDPSCGVLVENGDDEASRFASALSRVFDEGDFGDSLGVAGRRKAEAEFDIRTARAAYRRLFE